MGIPLKTFKPSRRKSESTDRSSLDASVARDTGKSDAAKSFFQNFRNYSARNERKFLLQSLQTAGQLQIFKNYFGFVPQDPYNGNICCMNEEDYPLHTDAATVYIALVDLDIDSDNTSPGGYVIPARSDLEEFLEDHP